MNDTFAAGDSKPPKVSARIQHLKNGLIFDPKKYEYREDWVPAKSALDVHSTSEMIEFLRKNPHSQIDARVCGISASGDRGMRKMTRKDFLEAAARRDSKRLREAVDSFAIDSGFDSQIVGSSDFTPLMGGPFNKQLYYRDYLRMIATCFYAYHHDPAARAVVSILCDFTMGRGFQLHAERPEAQILWDAFAEVNNFAGQMDHCAMETSIYGENMWWWLPNNQARISYQPRQGEVVPKGIIPRIRLIDPSNIAEIITVPEDMIEGILYYVWMAPTQYQMYTRDNQPSAKFIYNQIPAEQIIHEKINSVSNEKRGRSDYFPALGYMKRLRDGVNYSLVAQQKASAWCIDTTIQGDDQDISDYITQQTALGTIPTAGSEFVHTASITRAYLSNGATSKGGESPVFNWCLNMIAMASGIPVSYLGIHLAGGSSRASALVATEPVVKRFERRQLTYERTIRKIFNELMRKFDIQSGCDIKFPELLTQDRSSLIRDLTLAQNNDWLSHSRCMEIAAGEFDVKDFNPETEMEQIKADQAARGGLEGNPDDPAATNPLTAAGAGSQTQKNKGPSLPSAQKKNIKDNIKTL